MTMVITGVTMGADTLALFQQASVRCEPVLATITSNLVYILALEYGHSQQAPDGMLRRQINAFGYMLDEEIAQAFDEFAPDFQRVLEVGISRAAFRILAAIVEATPVDTGRAKGSWVARLSTGETFRGAPEVGPRAHRAILKGRRRAAARRIREAARALAKSAKTKEAP